VDSGRRSTVFSSNFGSHIRLVQRSHVLCRQEKEEKSGNSSVICCCRLRGDGKSTWLNCVGTRRQDRHSMCTPVFLSKDRVALSHPYECSGTPNGTSSGYPRAEGVRGLCCMNKVQEYIENIRQLRSGCTHEYSSH